MECLISGLVVGTLMFCLAAILFDCYGRKKHQEFMDFMDEQENARR